MFLGDIFFHSNEILLRSNAKQNLSLPCISLLGDHLSEYTYNFSSLKNVMFLFLKSFARCWVS